MERYTEEITAIAKGVPEVQDYFLFNGGFGGSGGGASPMAMAGFVLKPWSERDAFDQRRCCSRNCSRRCRRSPA